MECWIEVTGPADVSWERWLEIWTDWLGRLIRGGAGSFDRDYETFIDRDFILDFRSMGLMQEPLVQIRSEDGCTSDLGELFLNFAQP